MANILLEYMAERFSQSTSNEDNNHSKLPFITISREHGCPAEEIAKLLETKLNHHLKTDNSKKWKIISKEIMEQAAHELNVDTSRIKKVVSEEKRGAIDEILNSFSEKYYKSDRKIVNTIASTIIDFARLGNVIIIGRNGAGITNELPNGLHVRLLAPLEWRIKKLLENGFYNNEEEARFHAEDIDYNRNLYLKSKIVNEPVFGIYYNTQIFNAEEIANSIIFHLELIKGK